MHVTRRYQAYSYFTSICLHTHLCYTPMLHAYATRLHDRVLAWRTCISRHSSFIPYSPIPLLSYIITRHTIPTNTLPLHDFSPATRAIRHCTTAILTGTATLWANTWSRRVRTIPSSTTRDGRWRKAFNSVDTMQPLLMMSCMALGVYSIMYSY